MGTLNQMQFAGDYQLENILVHASSTKGKLDIRNLMLELNIYESIYTPNISGSLTIADTTNHLQNVPFKGQEELEFRFGVKDNELLDFTKNRMRVTKVSNMVRTEERQQVYTLNFTTREMVNNLRMTLNRAYNGTADIIIASLLKNDLKTTKPFNAEQTTHSMKVLGNRMNPFTFCNMVSQRSSSQLHADDHLLFYENHRGYHLNSLSFLASQPTHEEYFTMDADYRDVERDMHKILEYKLMKNQDVLAHIASGLLGAQSYTYNLNTKSYNKITQTYFDKFNRTEHTSDKPFPIYTRDPESADNKTIDSFSSSVIRTHTTQSYLHTQSATDETDYNNASSRTLSRHFSKLSYDALSVKCTVPGNSTLAAGDIVSLKLPSLEPVNKQSDRTNDVYMSGRYILTNIVHTLSPQGYTTTFDAVKDSVEVPYISSTTPLLEDVQQ